MARKVRDILKARGYTDEELAGMETLLKDQKFCSAIEAEAAAADENDRLAKERQDLLTQNESWYNDYATPELEKARQEAIQLASDKAALEAKLKAQQKYGMAKIAKQEGHEADNETPPKPEPKPAIDESKFVDRETFNQTARNVGDSMIMLTDILEDHRELFGKRLPGGMSKLRDDWNAAVKNEHYKGSLRDYWEKTFKVQERRDTIAADEAKRHEDEIRKDERTKTISEFGNPNTRPMTPSHNPFTNKGTHVDATGKKVDAGQPWERSKEQRSTERISKFTTKALSSSVQ